MLAVTSSVGGQAEPPAVRQMQPMQLLQQQQDDQQQQMLLEEDLSSSSPQQFLTAMMSHLNAASDVTVLKEIDAIIKTTAQVRAKQVSDSLETLKSCVSQTAACIIELFCSFADLFLRRRRRGLESKRQKVCVDSDLENVLACKTPYAT
jgi:transcriptional regulator of nitric oxide reductase